MTTRHTTLNLVALGGLALIGGPAAAQVGINPYAGLPNFNAPAMRPYAAMPGLSPYLNIAGGVGNNRLNNAAINYFNFARPAIQAQNPLSGFYANSALQQQYIATQGAPGDEFIPDPFDVTSGRPRPAGHPTAFFNTGGFFNSLGTIGSARPQAGGGFRPQQQQQPTQQRQQLPAQQRR